MMGCQPTCDRKINLLIVTTGLGIGGAEVVVRDLVREIDEDTFNVSVCCLTALGEIGEELAVEEVDICTLSSAWREGKVDYFTFLKLRQVVKAKDIDVVHTHTTAALMDACVCKLTMPRLKVVHTFHYGNYPNRDRRMLRMERLCSKVANRLVAVGEMQRRQIQSVFRLGDHQIATVWNGVKPSRESSDPDFHRWAQDKGTVLVGTLANLIEQKGLRDLLQVARLVCDVHANARFVIAGEGQLRSQLECLRHDLRLDDNVAFVGWLRNAAATVLPAIDIYFQPSLWEANSIAVLEGMAAGKPVVATCVGEAPRIICDGIDGILAAPRDIQAMADSICILIEDAGLRRRLGGTAARKAAEQFTVERMARAYEDIYVDVLSSVKREPSR